MNPYIEAVDSLPEGHAIYPMIEGDNLILRTMTPDEVRMILSIVNMVGVIGLIFQKNITEFQQYIEFHFFPPDSEVNKDIISLVWKWQTIPFIILLLPTVCVDHEGNKYVGVELLRKAASKFGLELIKDALPLMTGNIKLDDGSEPYLNKMGIMAVKPDIPLHNLYWLK